MEQPTNSMFQVKVILISPNWWFFQVGRNWSWAVPIHFPQIKTGSVLAIAAIAHRKATVITGGVVVPRALQYAARSARAQLSQQEKHPS